jgi:hypothetical protein
MDLAAALLGLLVLSSLGSQGAPRETATTHMTKGKRYSVTVLFADNSAGVAALKQGLEADLDAPNFVVDRTLTKVLANTDGTTSGKVVGLYLGGSALRSSPHWTLLQLAELA